MNKTECLKLNGLDLFSGIGGISVALSPWVQTIAYCERDEFAQKVLLARMQSGEIDRAPIWDDVQTLKSEMLPKVDIIFGGFPCQDISIAGIGTGLAGKRSGLFFEIVRLIGECRPRFVFLENVPALTFRGLDSVLLELAKMGYDARWTIVSAAQFGACHLRERIWILGHSNRFDCELPHHPNTCGEPTWQQSQQFRGCENKDFPLRNGYQRHSNWASQRLTEPRVGRAGNGIPHRMDRLRCLGNSVVPQAARFAFMKLAGLV